MPLPPPELPPGLAARLVASGQMGRSVQITALSGGRSNRVWRLRDGASDRVLKLFGPDGANPMFANDPQREIAALHALADTGLAPRPRAWGYHEGSAWLLYDYVSGEAWRQDCAVVAGVLHRLHRQTPIPGLPAEPGGSLALSEQTRAILGRCTSAGRAALMGFEPCAPVPPASRLVLIHGDPVPGNIVADDGDLTLIDWQCPALGDACADLALFASPAMQALYRGKPLGRHEVSDFLTAYPDRATVARFHALRPWFGWRMAAYCQWQSERGQSDYGDVLALETAELRNYSCAM